MLDIKVRKRLKESIQGLNQTLMSENLATAVRRKLPKEDETRPESHRSKEPFTRERVKGETLKYCCVFSRPDAQTCTFF